ncbi:MAG: hypothetical protein Greene101449_444 [Candidatus Peregrinibacteria bacterium Greene1014_49]|nr:MAG: hypothetical protein Greene101449_444 [Candidatus Peregrinibacteria bacterium Greene1014_49]
MTYTNPCLPAGRLQRLATVAIVALTLIPNVANAYMTAEDVLDEFFLPPTARESKDRLARQSTVSAERRAREQDEAFEIQHAAAPEEIPEEELVPTEEAPNVSTAEPTLNSTDLELLRTLRLLGRVTDRQRVLQYGATVQGDPLHGGAPPLAPTGMGAWIAATTMIGAVAWTLRRAGKAGRKAWSV